MSKDQPTAAGTLQSPVKGGTAGDIGAVQPDPVPGEAKAFDDFSQVGRICVEPLRRGLEVCVAGNAHPWEAMRSMCVDLVEKYGSDKLVWSEDDVECDPAVRLSLSAYFLKLAIHLNSCIRNLNERPLDLTADKSFSEPCPLEIGSMLEAITRSSVSKSRAVAQAPVVPPSPSKGGKAPPATTTSAPSQLTGRDALFALSGLCRESDWLWMDGYEYDYIADLHASLVASFPVYSERCSLRAAPDTANVELKVEVGTISSLWVLTTNEDTRARKPRNGAFDGVTGYFLLGANNSSSSTDPLLTKISSSYTEIHKLEKQSATLRDHVLLKSLDPEIVARGCQALLIAVYNCFQQDSSENDVSASTSSEGDQWAVEMSLNDTSRGKIRKKVVFDISANSLGALSSAISFRTGADCINESNVSSFLWFCFSG